jgi:hypothetical protein
VTCSCSLRSVDVVAAVAVDDVSPLPEERDDSDRPASLSLRGNSVPMTLASSTGSMLPVSGGAAGRNFLVTTLYGRPRGSDSTASISSFQDRAVAIWISRCRVRLASVEPVAAGDLLLVARPSTATGPQKVSSACPHAARPQLRDLGRPPVNTAVASTARDGSRRRTPRSCIPGKSPSHHRRFPDWSSLGRPSSTPRRWLPPATSSCPAPSGIIWVVVMGRSGSHHLGRLGCYSRPRPPRPPP